MNFLPNVVQNLGFIAGMFFTRYSAAMQRLLFLTWVYAFSFCPSLSYEAHGQPRGIDTDEVEPLIDAWNSAHNTRNTQNLERIYADQLVFNTQTLPRSKVIAQKLRLFNQNRDFRQRIITVIRYTPYKSGVVRCDFSKEVRANGSWKRVPSYLLVRQVGTRYRIVGEVDVAAPKPVQIPEKSDLRDTFARLPERNSLEEDTTVVMAEPAPVSERPDSQDAAEAVSLVDISSFRAIVDLFLSTEEITVPKGYVFILVGILAVGGLMIFVSDSIHQSRRKQQTIPGRYEEMAHAVQQSRTRAVFESFVITLFDPMIFQYRRIQPDRISDGKVFVGERGPDFVCEFSHKGVQATFGVKCQYYKLPDTREVQLFSPSQQQTIRRFEDEKGMKVYYVLGFGGRPDDPKELYLLPSDAIKREFVHKTALRHYSKSGMFFYNNAVGRLQ